MNKKLKYISVMLISLLVAGCCVRFTGKVDNNQLLIDIHGD